MAERAIEVARPDRHASSRLMTVLPGPLQAVVSKPAQRAYIGSIFFLLIAPLLLGVSTIAYWLFYFNFVPQVSFERPVHLQFGDGNPFATAAIGSELVPLQAYDVSVALHLPRSPRNVEAGNFMVDLKIFPQSSGGSYASNPITTPKLAESSRPGILTFASPMVDTARRFSRLPFYVFGWKHEAENLRIMMMERVEFSKGKGRVPGSLRLEIGSRRMQVYSAVVRFEARFTGLRWVMYNWRILSFLTFSSAFWVVSMIVTLAVYMALSSTQEESQATPSDSDEDGSDSAKAESDDDGSGSIKTESDEEGMPTSSSGNTAGRLGTSHVRRQPEKEEEIEEPTKLEPLFEETGQQRVDQRHAASTQSQFVDSQTLQRRRAQS